VFVMMVTVVMHCRLRRNRCSRQYDQRDHRKQNPGHLHIVSPWPCFNYTPQRSDTGTRPFQPIPEAY
jgi:hypothetical protein